MKTLRTTIAIADKKTTITRIINWLDNDIVLNVGFGESIIRGMIAIFVPWPFLLMGHEMLIAAAPVMFYLFITALTHFCFIRCAWEHWFKHLPTQPVCEFAIDLRIPIKTI